MLLDRNTFFTQPIRNLNPLSAPHFTTFQVAVSGVELKYNLVFKWMVVKLKSGNLARRNFEIVKIGFKKRRQIMSMMVKQCTEVPICGLSQFVQSGSRKEIINIGFLLNGIFADKRNAGCKIVFFVSPYSVCVKFHKITCLRRRI